MFQPSSLSISECQTRIARAGSASSFTNELSRALECLQDAVKWWNREELWDFCRTVSSDIATTSASAVYALPYNLRAIYDVTIGDPARKLSFIGRRNRDLWQVDAIGNGTPGAYDLFQRDSLGEIELVPGQSTNETMVIKYYRRLWIPCSSAAVTVTGVIDSDQLFSSALFGGITVGTLVTGSNIAANTFVTAITDSSTLTLSNPLNGTASIANFGGAAGQLLDIPEDYDDGVLARAKSLYLTDREVDSNRRQAWMAEALATLDRAKKNNRFEADEEIVFLSPQDATISAYNPNAALMQYQEWPYY